MKTRALVRAAFIIAFTALVVIIDGGDFALPWHPWASFGFGIDPHGNVTTVDASAAKAGLRTGEQVRLERMPPRDRWYLTATSIAPDGRLLRVPLSSGRIVTVVAHARPRTSIDNVTDIFSTLGAILYILLAGALVLMRPSPVTWAFYIFSL
ncbi:MAG TPA: hypothetical protein VFA29_00195, partial [Candidatus Baltobacteraceae bacterium]|nr:hypothetical protein [Candidatus Baltobacteraceae bacterium]